MRVATLLAEPDAYQSGWPVIAWPLERDPGTLLVPDRDAAWAGPGTLVDDPTDAARLRELRAQGAAIYHSYDFDPTFTRTSDGRVYAVYVRDEVPEEMRAAIEAAWARHGY